MPRVGSDGSELHQRLGNSTGLAPLIEGEIPLRREAACPVRPQDHGPPMRNGEALPFPTAVRLFY
jgi:hypothetical protein